MFIIYGNINLTGKQTMTVSLDNTVFLLTI
jgi:hypothetical protein